MVKLTHLNQSGEAHMVDVGGKDVTAREAVAEGLIRMQGHQGGIVNRAGLEHEAEPQG